MNDLCYDHCLQGASRLLRCFGSDGLCTNKTLGAVLIAVTSTVSAFKCRYCLEFCDEWVWVEVSTSEGLTLLTENQYFLPDSKAEIISIHFYF